VAEATAAGAEVVCHPTNLGQGAALQTGFEFALRSPDMKYVVTFDADGQHQVEDAVRMIHEMRANHFEVMLGSRFLERRSVIPFGRRMTLRAAVIFTRATTGLPLTDAHNGLRVLSRRAVETMNVRLHGMAHASEMLQIIARHGLSYHEIPVSVLYTDYSRRKGQPSINAFNIAFDILLDRVRIAR
jgi:polyprenyl-phospho-N-acetylgalactosaminyl synthase